MIDAIVFAITIVLPNLALMWLGFFMQRRGEASQTFIDQASSFVFNYCLPCLLFFSVVDSDVDYSKQITLIVAGILVTFILFIGAEIYAKYFVSKPADQGVFVQGIFRSNMAIIGLATVANAYGERGLSIGAVYMGVVTILFNILAVITLSRVSKSVDDTWLSRSTMIVKKLFTNPLIIALVAAFAYKVSPLPPITGVINTTGDLLAAVGLEKFAERKPNELSGGQQQRVAIARALLNEPAVILADEPTGQLDSSTGREIMDLFSSIHQTGTTIIVVTHDTKVAACAQRRIHIHDGHIVKDTQAPLPERVEAAPYSAVPPPLGESGGPGAGPGGTGPNSGPESAG